MSNPAQPAWSIDWRIPPERMRVCVFGFLYWLCFLLALEPGNLLNASQAGSLPSFPHEVLRIGVAALLGAVATAIPALLTEKLPVAGAAWARRALIHAAGAAGLAFVLILVSCVLAAWILQGMWLPAAGDIQAQLVGNWLLLTYALGALTAILHAAGHLKNTSVPAVPAPIAALAAPLNNVCIKTRSGTLAVGLADVIWIESQGNYLALHTRVGSHLVRDTLSAFEARLDPARFVRIHRRVIVAVDRIAAIQPTGNGDALASLVDGQELRVSRSHRAAVTARWKPDQASP